MIRKLLKTTVIAAFVLGLGQTAFAAQPVSMDELLEQVRQGRVKDAAENQKRIQEFQAARGRQQELLRQMQAEQTRQERLSEQLESSFEVNDAAIMDLERALQDRLGELKELFGVLQQAAGDARGNFDTSVTQIQFPDRGEWLTQFAQKMGSTTRMPTMEEIERIWFELQREMTESAKVLEIPATVVNSDGEEEQRQVVRVGLFNVVSDGDYLEYVPETGRLVELQRQPQSRYTGRAEGLQETQAGLAGFGIDPTRGQLLALLVQSPSLTERIAQGKEVGYVIITLGIVAILIAIWRLLALSATSAKVNRQAKNLENPGNNPLGRVLKIAHENPESDVEALELKLGEQILKETPKFNKMLPFLKIISVVAPLLGLLGTVTGMIITFQAITLYGAGDPKLMAGGISTALVTTVLGLVVAIPTVFMHTLVQSRAKRLTQILQEEAAGMLSERAERMG
ncbi:MAG: energy transducer TonB [Xanthomonadales bacterium]|nr:energy transducer TonB [Xanthomonadales bacterium]